MNQDTSFPPILPPSTELGALLFAVLPCLQETYRPLASLAYHMTELSKLKNIPSMPSLSGISGIDALIMDKDAMLRSLSFYGRIFHMPLLSTIANLLQAMQFYQAYKDILPGLFSAMGGGGSTDSSFDSMAGLFSALNNPGGTTSNLFSMLGGLSPDLLSSLFSGFSDFSASAATTNATTNTTNTASEEANDSAFTDTSETSDATENNADMNTTGPADSSPSASSFDLHDSLYSFMTPEQKQIYEQLMHTD